MTEDAHISIPVPPPIAAAWQALPAERRASYARAIVGSCTSTLRIIRSARESGKIAPFHH